MRPARRNDLSHFLTRRQPSWRRLETLLERVEATGLPSLSSEELREFGGLYRRASSDLVAARAKTANAEILQYLNDLVARSYSQVYRTRRFELSVVWTFLFQDFPRLFRHCGRYISVASLLFLLGSVAGWVISAVDPPGAFYLIPPEMVRQIPAMRSMWSNKTGHEDMPAGLMPIMSTFLMTHNIGIGLVAFAGGALFGLGTLWAMIQNGLILGVLGQGMTTPQTALVFWSLILPHGVLELPAICVMGGAGFILAGALLAPGERTRLEALIERGRLAVLLATGGAVMLVLAGLIEGMLTPLASVPPVIKLVFAAAVAVGMVTYFTFAGRNATSPLLGVSQRESQDAQAAAL